MVPKFETFSFSDLENEIERKRSISKSIFFLFRGLKMGISGAVEEMVGRGLAEEDWHDRKKVILVRNIMIFFLIRTEEHN